MKESRYNIISPYNTNQNLFFNGMTRKGFLISKTNSNDLIRVLQAPDYFSNYNAYSSLLNKLYEGGFIIDEQFDEFSYLQNMYESYRNEESMLLSILTTYSCNFSCWYCTQNHNQETITPDIIKHIKKFIQVTLETKPLKSFELSWFGGEPLLCPEAIIEISDFTQQQCTTNHVEFINGITTNGSLLNPSLIKAFKNISLFNYQITIDGCERIHNTTRQSPSIPNSFKLICNNFKLIIDNIPQCNITLRFNYTSKNISSELIEDLNKYLS